MTEYERVMGEQRTVRLEKDNLAMLVCSAEDDVAVVEEERSVLGRLVHSRNGERVPRGTMPASYMTVLINNLD